METKKTNSVLIIIIIVLAILVVAGIGIGAYFWGKSKAGTSTKTTASPTVTLTKSAATTATPAATKTTSQATESAQTFVEKFMKMTLGTLPGASLDLVKARTYLSDTMKAQYSGDDWAAQFYGIQNGPDSYQFLLSNPTEDGAVVKYNVLWGGEVGTSWTFTLAKDGNNWFVNGFSSSGQ